MSSNWKLLIKRYADSKTICNCGNAYLVPCGVASVYENGDWVKKTSIPTCQYGCSANQIVAKEYVAQKVLEEQQ